MPQISLRIHVITQIFEEGSIGRLGEALFFPEVTCLDDQADDVQNLVVENVLSLLVHLPNVVLSQRQLDAKLEQFRVQLTVEPAERSRSWSDPVTLTLPAVKWRQASDAFVVYIPSLEIEVLANKEEDLPRLIEDQIQLALFRTKATRSLKSMVTVARCRELRLHSTDLEHFAISPKQQAQEEQKPDTADSKVLKKVGSPLSGAGISQTFERDDVVRQLAEVLSGRMARSVLLVGPSGVGKTAILKEVVRRRSELGLGSWNFWGTSGSQLVSGMTGFGMWQERCELLRREMVDEKVILHAGSLMELMEVGRSECQPQGIASYLRPAIARGEILLVTECTAEQLSLIERQDIALLRAFLQIRVDEPPQAIRISLLTQVARSGSTSSNLLFSAEAIAELERLHRRFATYSAFPARPIRFLQNLRRDVAARQETPTSGNASQRGEPFRTAVTASDVTRAFSRETGLPMWMLDDSIPLDLSAAESWFSSRVIGQPDAVDLVVNLLATLKVQLSREHRPLASFLFIGPTGVGKTEMAKTLAEFLFGSSGRDDSRLVRIDMSEYTDPSAVQRLIGGTVESEGVLTARVREQPFAVVLLDEFEKAHSSLLDLLLQILGEGRLTDAAGRVADFRNCVIIMTSNLGAGTFARGSVGFGLSDVDVRQSRDHFEKAVRDFVRPELFNRIDRIVPFSPLDGPTARKVVDRQLELIRQRDGLKYRRVTLSLGEDVLDYLLEHGFEPRYGARSLKRVMEKKLLAPLAERFNQYAGDTVLNAECHVVEPNPGSSSAASVLRHSVRSQTDSSGRRVTSIGADAGTIELVTQLRDLRSRLQRLQASPVMTGLENRVFQLERAERRWNRLARQTTAMLKERQELNVRRDWLHRFDRFLQSVVDHEDKALMSLYADERLPISESIRSIITDGHQRLEEFLFELLDLQQDKPDEIRLLLIADDSRVFGELAQAYWKIATEMGADGALWQFLPSGLRREVIPEDEWTTDRLKWDQVPQPPNSGQPETWQLIPRKAPSEGGAKPLLFRQRVSDPLLFLNSRMEGVLGVMLDLTGDRVFHRFVREDGLHRFILAQGKPDCSVFTGLPEIPCYLPPFGIDRRDAVSLSNRCRDYDYVRTRISDSLISEPATLLPGNLSVTLGPLLLQRHRQIAEALIES